MSKGTEFSAGDTAQRRPEPEFRSLQPVLQVLQVWFQANLPNWTLHSEHQNQRQGIS